MATAKPDEALRRFKEFLSREGLRFTRQRRAIARVFYRGNKHRSLSELLDAAREEEPSIGYATVYRTMKLLSDSGLAVEHQFGDGQARFEPVTEGEHHDHMICLDCGRIFEFEDAEIERRQDLIARQRGFRVASHKHEIYVRCRQEGCEGLSSPLPLGPVDTT